VGGCGLFGESFARAERKRRFLFRDPIKRMRHLVNCGQGGYGVVTLRVAGSGACSIVPVSPLRGPGAVEPGGDLGPLWRSQILECDRRVEENLDLTGGYGEATGKTL